LKVGPSLIIIPVISAPVTLGEIFRHSMMLTCDEWLTKHVARDGNQTQTMSSRLPYSDQRSLHLTAEGIASIRTFPVDALKQSMLCSLSEDDYLRIRPNLAKSLSISCMARHIFNTPYPSIHKCFGNATSDCIPLLHSDYDHGDGTDAVFVVSDVAESRDRTRDVAPRGVLPDDGNRVENADKEY
jgi:hypothetical protein